MKELGPYRPALPTAAQRDAITGLGVLDQGSLIFVYPTWFYWDGAQWLPITVAGPTGFASKDLAGDVSITTADTDLDVDSYNLAGEGIWRVTINTFVQLDDVGTLELKITDNSNNQLAHAKVESSDTATGQVVLAINLRRHVTMTSAGTIKLRARSTVTTSKILSAANAGTKADWERISL